MDNNLIFTHPRDISLEDAPLIEAWFEIRWDLEKSGLSDLNVDPGYQYALGTIYSNVKSRYPYREELPLNQVPEGLTPHRVRHRFRPKKDEWPAIQVGPGVATINLTTNYSWEYFLEEIDYLRNILIESYKDYQLNPIGYYLRYKNGFPFGFSSSNVQNFLLNSLNTKFEFPESVPGDVAGDESISTLNHKSTYQLKNINSLGLIKINTGSGKDPSKQTTNVSEQRIELLLLQLEIHTKREQTPNLHGSEFHEWLDISHSIIHEWFFSFIDGSLYEQLKGE